MSPHFLFSPGLDLHVFTLSVHSAVSEATAEDLTRQELWCLTAVTAALISFSPAGCAAVQELKSNIWAAVEPRAALLSYVKLPEGRRQT